MREKTRTRREVAALAGRQHGVVATGQLVDMGLTRAGVSRMRDDGRLHHLHQGVYAVGHPAVSRHGRCMAAVLACGNGAILSHGSAAWLWGLSGRYLAVVEVTAIVPRHLQDGIRVHSSATLRAEDRSTSEGVPVTSVARTLLDFAGSNRFQPAPALQQASRLGLLDLGELDDLLKRSRGRRGVRRLRTALLDFRDPAFTRSGLERAFRRLVREAGLPIPSSNYFVGGYELDAYWPDIRFAVELDTYDYHGDPRSFERDRIRQEDLKLAGIELTRITGKRVEREPAAVMKRLRRLLAQRQREMTAAK